METTIVIILGLCWDNEKENGNYYSILGQYCKNKKENGNCYSILGLYWGEWKIQWKHWCYIGIMEKKMETAVVCWGSILRGIMEKKMETTI